ncbi:MAG: hypothetical protein ACKVHE_31050 [Planctomycetales bacterium]|jgi:uncharacterized membrane protein
MDMQVIDTVFRIVHVATAITLVGGSVFMAFVLAPAAAQLSDAEHDKLRAALLGRWKKFVHLGVVLFIVSGFYNFAQMMPDHKGDRLYHVLVGTKVLIAFSVFFIAEALVGKSKAFEKMRANRPKWLKILVLLASVIVCISGFVKVRKYEAPADVAASAVGVE